MEVHKHPHHVTHKKKWTEYLLEFFMLFLAVFLGFVAENIRETSVEHHKEKDYIESLVQNLKDDTSQLNSAITRLPILILKMDSLALISKADFTQIENLKTITRLYINDGLHNVAFRNNNSTLAQLKAGSFRLIQKDHVADSIARYDLINTFTERQGDFEAAKFNDFLTSADEVFDFSSIMTDTIYLKNLMVIDKNIMVSDAVPPAINADKEKQRIFFNKAVRLMLASKGYLRLLKNQLQYAVRLVQLLQKEYHLENK